MHLQRIGAFKDSKQFFYNQTCCGCSQIIKAHKPVGFDLFSFQIMFRLVLYFISCNLHSLLNLINSISFFHLIFRWHQSYKFTDQFLTVCYCCFNQLPLAEKINPLKILCFDWKNICQCFAGSNCYCMQMNCTFLWLVCISILIESWFEFC